MVRSELLADAVAVAAELVGNAIRHAVPLPGGVIRMAWRVRYASGAQMVDMWVTDGGGPTVPRMRQAGLDAIDGRGLAIVEALAVAWGVDSDGLGQSVWAQLRAPAAIGRVGMNGPRTSTGFRHTNGGKNPTVELPVR